MPFLDRTDTGMSVMSSPARQIRPAVGLSSPASCMRSVVLPAPLGPMIACNSWGSRLSDTLSVAMSAPNRFVRLRVARIGSGMGRSRSLRLPEQARNPAFHEQHEEDEDRPEDDLPMGCPRAQHQLQDH